MKKSLLFLCMIVIIICLGFFWYKANNRSYQEDECRRRFYEALENIGDKGGVVKIDCPLVFDNGDILTIPDNFTIKFIDNQELDKGS